MPAEIPPCIPDGTPAYHALQSIMQYYQSGYYSQAIPVYDSDDRLIQFEAFRMEGDVMTELTQSTIAYSRTKITVYKQTLWQHTKLMDTETRTYTFHW